VGVWGLRQDVLVSEKRRLVWLRSTLLHRMGRDTNSSAFYACLNLATKELYAYFMDDNRGFRIATLERTIAFCETAEKNLEILLASPLETPESRQKARRELVSILETQSAAERELAKLKTKQRT
jgi:hypothetical protein